MSALNSLTENSETDDFTFKGKKSTGIVFEGNAIEDFAAGGSKEDSNVSIEYGEKSVHSAGTVYWNPAQGMREEGMKGAEGGGAFPSMGLLLHEMGHAALYNEYGDEKQNLFANEEQMIIDHLENPGMQSMGFGYRTQHNVFPNRAEALINNQGSLGSYKATYYIPSIPPTIRIR